MNKPATTLSAMCVLFLWILLSAPIYLFSFSQYFHVSVYGHVHLSIVALGSQKVGGPLRCTVNYFFLPFHHTPCCHDVLPKHTGLRAHGRTLKS